MTSKHIPRPPVGAPSVTKPLGHKAYGSIGHLPASRLGPGDHKVTEGQARLCCERPRDRRDVIVVQEKLDGGCVAAARLGDDIVALGRAGHLARTSPFIQHHVWADWVDAHADAFRAVLGDGERLCGEWLALAHGTRYDLAGRPPFVAFDLMRGMVRTPYLLFAARVAKHFEVPPLLHLGAPLPLAAALEALGTHGRYGACEPAEGVVYRVERDAAVDFLAKYVRPEKVDGALLPEVNDGIAHWNWQP